MSISNNKVIERRAHRLTRSHQDISKKVREIGSKCVGESEKSLNLVNPSTNMQFFPPISSKTTNNKVVIGPCTVAMILSHPYQLKMVTDFVLHNFIQPKEKLILVDDLEWNYTKIIQGNSGKSYGLAPIISNTLCSEALPSY
jgi:hypothetical protein